MPDIQVLPAHLADLIAAGEVVERPASVAKELCENAIDAGASKITVEIQRGGLSLVRVTDNGCGIPAGQLKTAFLRHATSKLKTEYDLEAIGTLGFRGEALAAISAVSKVDVLTCTPDADMGATLSLEGGVPGEVEEAGCPKGTTFLVQDLFYNTPARLKFLKKDSAEGAAVFSAVQRVALSHPEVSVRFIRDGKQELLTPGDGNLKSAVYAVLGRELALGLTEVSFEGQGVRVEGFTSLPSCCRGSRNLQYFFVNGRQIKSRTLAAAVEQAYANQKMVGKYPGCVLHLTIRLNTVDVNVHPAKTEVRFTYEQSVFSAVYRAVLTTLQGIRSHPGAILPDPVIPGMEPSPDMEQIPISQNPAQPSAGAPDVPAPALGKSSFASAPAASIPRGSVGSGTGSLAPGRSAAPLPPFPSSFSAGRAASSASAPSRTDRAPFRDPIGNRAGGWSSGSGAHVQSQSHEFRPAQPDTRSAGSGDSAPAPSPVQPPAPQRDAATPSGTESRAAQTPEPLPNQSAEWKQTVQPVSSVQAVPETADDVLPEQSLLPDAPTWRVAGEVLHTYIIAEQGDTIYIIDKHAAHERMNFDRMKAEGYNPMAQTLLTPQICRMNEEDREILREHSALLADFGFEVDELEGSLVVRQAPFDVDPGDISATLEEIAFRLHTCGTADPTAARDELFHTMACKAAIKGGWHSTPQELERVAQAVLSGEVRYCPHGRPVAIELSRKDLEKQFRRI